ncbi:glycosyltransferase [Galbibacter mesophilus]|uniref:glycosyltransferase n=1 Tax=Galbibacter mesophilus TaxID=379069 RepID=UPI00191F8AFC|nr:glycosyltransferase [Galbibacter mesophilus]MCM5663484.1 glycosyltransferase [Galbibacter mesophilus]
MKKIVVSAINFTSGGPLSIMRDCLASLEKDYSSNYKIIALVHSKDLYDFKSIDIIEFPLAKRSWFIRIFYEYFYFYFYSLKLKPDYWLSMHDISPNVKCENRFVYCHNPTPFYDVRKKDLVKNTKTFLFSNFYKFLYRINIFKNKFVIVQQDWIRQEFVKFWGLNNVLVAYPEIDNQNNLLLPLSSDSNKSISEKIRFFYPSFPRPFKNFEIICQAFSLLPDDYKKRCEIYLTIDININLYSKELFKKYGGLTGLNFIGLVSREMVYNYYNSADCLIFPSKLETWGLPITEFKITNKPMLIADKPYAHETVGDYENVSFFNPECAEDLKNLMISFLDNKIKFSGNKQKNVSYPFVKGWPQLLDSIFDYG